MQLMCDDPRGFWEAERCPSLNLNPVTSCSSCVTEASTVTLRQVSLCLMSRVLKGLTLTDVVLAAMQVLHSVAETRGKDFNLPKTSSVTIFDLRPKNKTRKQNKLPSEFVRTQPSSSRVELPAK